MDGLIHDIRLAVRGLLTTPAVTAAAVLALALTIGVNTAIFSVVDAALLRPLPYERPNDLVTVWQSWNEKGFNQLPALPADFVEWRKQSGAFAQLAASRPLDFNLTGVGEAQRLHGARVSANLFSLLGVRPTIGRDFLASDDQPGAANVVMLSDGLWRRQFGARPDIVGRQVALDGASYTVVGVMPRGFAFALDWRMTGLSSLPVDAWVPLALAPDQLREGFALNVVGRLKSGVTPARADGDVRTIEARLAAQDPERKGIGASVVSLRDLLTRDVRPAVLALAVAVGLVLIISCANVANLLLARATTRQREIAVRAALGASRGALVRQLLAESLVLAGVAGVCGAGLALVGADLLARYAPDAIQRAGAIRVDLRMLGFSLLASLLSGVACGLAPIAGALRANLEQALRQSARGGTGSMRQGRVRSALVVAEIALALVLVVGSALLLNSFFRLVSTDPGFNPHGLTTFHISLPDARYGSPERRAAFFADALTRIRALPEVLEAGAVSSPPLAQAREVFFNIEGRVETDQRRMPVATSRMVSGDYFRVMGMAPVGGRTVAESDRPGSLPVVVVDEAFARKYWPNEDPIGKRIMEGGGPGGSWLTVVGVVRTVQQYSLGSAARPGMYVSYRQSPRKEMTIVARARSASIPIAASVRGVVKAMDADLPVDEVRTLDDVLAQSLAPRTFSVSLLTVFAALALLLAAIGVYAVMSYGVRQRAREIAIRKALGAQPVQVMALVLRQGLALTAIGLVLGCLAAAVTTRLLASQLYGITATDPMTYVGSSAVLVATAMFACYLPARAGNRVEAMATLRQE